VEAAVVLTGFGSIFSSCADLRRVLDGGIRYVWPLLPLQRSALERLAFFDRPTLSELPQPVVST